MFSTHGTLLSNDVLARGESRRRSAGMAVLGTSSADDGAGASAWAAFVADHNGILEKTFWKVPGKVDWSRRLWGGLHPPSHLPSTLHHPPTPVSHQVAGPGALTLLLPPMAFPL